jgi:roadblock/LC7 domain-containing protein
MFTSLFRTYLYAKREGTPFFIEHDNWHYTYKKGWHDYCKSLTELNKDEHFDSIERIGIDPKNEAMKKFTVADLVGAAKETFILNDDLQAKVDAYVKELGEYTSLYVRRGDKINEMELISLDDILAQTTIRDDGRTIFVQTDDYSVVKDMMAKFPSCKIKTLTKESASGATNNDMINWTPEQRKEHTEELLVSCGITARAKEGWTYYLSNVGNTIKLLGYERMHMYIDGKTTKEEVEKEYALESKPFAD